MFNRSDKFELVSVAEPIESRRNYIKNKHNIGCIFACMVAFFVNEIFFENFNIVLLQNYFNDLLAMPAMLSYINQARDEAALGRFSKAQQLCLELAKLRPGSDYAYSALFDSALYARQIGLESNYKAALSSLDKLCQDFPDDSRNFYARLAQAEILRMLNAFADARKLYNEIINKYSAHPEINLAWLGLADSTLAQGNRAADAAAIYERLYSLPEMPAAAKAEAAFKWAFALERAGRTREANEVWWITSSHLLSDPNIGVSGKYWIGRSLYSLAKSLEASGMLRDARAAYELISKHKLPAASIAEKKLFNKGVK